ncbi:MAG TPA: 3-oxoacyl-[acyl-carrier-protein] synthase III C-terminal domain-containing protein [Elusimicrobiota bacterium]|jgi:alkylresorcinol/alkylpyrone synthase|nr:3-oxoacyl-[acyl-carrier-protein] synthase III C-terminal domain-containing protein [Elusimicrobiota bacterium]
MIRVLSVAGALPRHRAAQADVRRTYASIFQDNRALRRYLPIFSGSGVDERRFVRPLDYYREGRSFSERNAVYIEEAPRLARAALEDALKAAARDGGELGHLISATTTGLATPSLEAILAHDMGLPPRMARTPLFGTGCASGAVALTRACEAAIARPGLLSAAVAVELCSLTLRHDDPSVANLVGCALFGDGAAAAVVQDVLDRPRWLGAPAPAVAAWESHLFPDSRGVMGWGFDGGGMRLVLTPEVPALVARRLKPVILDFLRRHGAAASQVRHWVLHPGGIKVIEAYEAAFGLSAWDTRWSRRCLRAIGNVSSASVLFMLEDLQREGKPRAGDVGLVAALGPGFAAEMLLLRW